MEAATALLIWGGRISVISSHNGKNNPFNQFVKDIENGVFGEDAAVHVVTFDDAVANGLYERVCFMQGKEATLEGKKKWYTKIRKAYGSRKAAMREELDAIPRDGSSVCLPGLWVEELLSRFVLAGDLGSKFHDVRIQNNAWLKNKVSIEPGESLWDAIAKAAAVTGQHVWLEPNGTLVVGDPFATPYQVKTALRLMKPLDNRNNVLDLQYVNDVSNVYSEIKILGQDNKGSHVLSSATAQTQYAYNRLKIVSVGDVETKAEADAALEKIKKDNNLQAYSLDATVDGWTVDGKVWTPGCFVNVETNALSNATAKWAVYGRTLMLSRAEGKTTKLRMKRQGDWAQPLLHKEPAPKKTAKRKRTNKDKDKTTGAST
ncbi:hypothetical protein [Acinetobacter chinensis]|uniref:hypothetical protein n=1 Tax=Acinetobacter chinensis TaxID=2004650 RepID=UPI00293448EE|nr:hypothetical protein [Acinetobacter chinensis]WOE42397.1 hypothetical protein QSG87_04445 [Acinetobacter chinensis]